MISAISQPQYLKQTPANSGKQVAIWLVLLLQQHDHPQCCKVASARAHQGFCISELSPLQIEAAGHTLRVYVLRGVLCLLRVLCVILICKLISCGCKRLSKTRQEHKQQTLEKMIYQSPNAPCVAVPWCNWPSMI